MGHNTSCGILPFKLELNEANWNWDVSEDNKKCPEWLKNLYFAFENQDFDVVDEGAEIDIGNGWLYNPNNYKEYDDLYMEIVHKGKYTVYSVNESQYSAGGGIEPSIVSLDKESLEMFKKDFNINGKILTKQKIYQTM